MVRATHRAGRAWKSASTSSDLLQQPMEFLAVELDGAELAQVVGDELRVEQPEAAVGEARREINERDLRSIALVGEHALAEEGAVERDAIEAADEARAAPHLDGVAMAEAEQVAIEPADALVDPGGAAPRAARRRSPR